MISEFTPVPDWAVESNVDAGARCRAGRDGPGYPTGPTSTATTAIADLSAAVPERRIEVFWPPYLFAGDRPEVEPARTEVRYGDVLAARVRDAGGLRSACLVRPGATTHSSDCEQRLVDLPLRVTGGDEIELEVPTAATIAPPGWYLLFVVDASGVPSIGRWVCLT